MTSVLDAIPPDQHFSLAYGEPSSAEAAAVIHELRPRVRRRSGKRSPTQWAPKHAARVKRGRPHPWDLDSGG